MLRFCTKTERKTSVFVKVFTLIRIKTDVFENAVKSGFPQKRRFLKTHWINVNTQNGGFLKRCSNNNKITTIWGFFYISMGFSILFCTKTEQCEQKVWYHKNVYLQKRSSASGQKTDVFSSVFVQNRSNVNRHKNRYSQKRSSMNGGLEKENLPSTRRAIRKLVVQKVR